MIFFSITCAFKISFLLLNFIIPFSMEKKLSTGAKQHCKFFIYLKHAANIHQKNFIVPTLDIK